MSELIPATTPYDADPLSHRYWSYRGNRALAAAYRKGWKARLDGKPETAVPYADHRSDSGSVTFSRAFRHAWQEGWDAALPSIKEASRE